ncbi:MAG: hypothetical protein ACLU8W_10290 [Clostridia bacterium]
MNWGKAWNKAVATGLCLLGIGLNHKVSKNINELEEKSERAIERNVHSILPIA